MLIEYESVVQRRDGECSRRRRNLTASELESRECFRRAEPEIDIADPRGRRAGKCCRARLRGKPREWIRPEHLQQRGASALRRPRMTGRQRRRHARSAEPGLGATLLIGLFQPNVVPVAVSVMIEHVCRRAICGRSSLGDGIGLRTLSFSGSLRVFVAVEACDMRKV